MRKYYNVEENQAFAAAKVQRKQRKQVELVN